MIKKMKRILMRCAKTTCNGLALFLLALGLLVALIFLQRHPADTIKRHVSADNTFWSVSRSILTGTKSTVPFSNETELAASKDTRDERRASESRIFSSSLFPTTSLSAIDTESNSMDLHPHSHSNTTSLEYNATSAVEDNITIKASINPPVSLSQIAPIAKDETEEEFMKRMEARMHKRKRNLEKHCRIFGINPGGMKHDVWNASIPTPRPWMYFSEQYKLIYSEIPKSGCSNWKKVMMVLNGIRNSTDNITQEQSHSSKLRMISTVHSLLEKDKQLYRNSTKLIVVRDPLERLVSAYVDKVMKNTKINATVFNKFSWEVAKKYGNKWKDNTNYFSNGVRHITVCQFQVAELECSQHGYVIRVINATYGRLDKYSCGPDPRWNGSACLFPHSYFVASQICDGKSQCDVVASQNQFGKVPGCDAIEPVLDIKYDCKSKEDFSTVTVCTDDTHRIKCRQNSVISIASAFFGRKNRNTCSYLAHVRSTECEAATATSAVAVACNNRPSCVVVANAKWIQSNPCPTTSKYLQVWYSCVSKEKSRPYPAIIKEKNTANQRSVGSERLFQHQECKDIIEIPVPAIYKPAAFVTKNYDLSATFDEFISYLIDPANADVTKDVIDHGPVYLKSVSVRHWQPYHALTYPCHIDYDVIAHVETIEEDARYVLKRIGAPENLHYPKGYDQKSGRSSTSRRKVEEFLQSLNSSTASKLIDLYLHDYKLFGYDVPSRI